jgi:hypothetical protein
LVKGWKDIAHVFEKFDERVCSGEIRIFPLTGLDARPYPHIKKMLSFLAGEGHEAEIRDVPFEFQRGANQMLTIRCGK